MEAAERQEYRRRKKMVEGIRPELKQESKHLQGMRDQNGVTSKPCEGCGNTFVTPYPTKKYCSSNCQKRAWEKRGLRK